MTPEAMGKPCSRDRRRRLPAMGIVAEVPADALQGFQALAPEPVVRAEPAQGVDHGGDFTVEQASRLGFDKGASSLAAVGVKQMCGFLPR